MSALHQHIQKQQSLACDLAGLLEALSLIDNDANTPGAVTSLINVAMMLAADLTNNLDTVALPKD